MNKKTPSFWYRKRGIKSWLLFPFSILYLCGRKIDVIFSKEKNPAIPVICIGNVTAGGSGKTPCAIAIMKIVKKYNIAKNPCFVTRGYKGGDEAVILQKEANTIISSDRYDAIKKAKNEGHDLVIMDDGFQNMSVKKDISLLVVDAKYMFGNEMLIPAGPLREPIKDAMERTNAIILVGDNKKIKETEKIVINSKIKTITNLPKDNDYMAFCGIAMPDKFFDLLEKCGYKIVDKRSYPDHYQYSENDINILIKEAENKGFKLITTEKDYVKIAEKYKNKICYLPIVLEFDNEEIIVNLLKNNLPTTGNQRT